MPRPFAKLPAESLLAVNNGVHVPWHGGTGRLMVSRPVLGSLATIEIDGLVVARTRKATLQDPWVESEIPGAEPHQLIVVQVQPAPMQWGVLVFVDGTCLQGGASLDEWRSSRPAPKDHFEEAMRPVYWWGDPWGARGAILFGAVTAVLMAAAAIASGAWSPAYLALGVLITFVVVAAWVLLVGLVVRWFQARRNWPWRLRVMAVLAVALGLPVAVILTLQAIAGSH